MRLKKFLKITKIKKYVVIPPLVNAMFDETNKKLTRKYRNYYVNYKTYDQERTFIYIAKHRLAKEK